MKDVSKRIPHREYRAGRICALLAVFVLCASAGIYFLGGGREEIPVLESTLRHVTLLSRDTGDIASIAVTPPSGEEYTVFLANGVPTLLGDDAFVFHDTRVQKLIDSAAHIEMEEALLDTGTMSLALAAFGLSPARASVTVTFVDGVRVTLRIGDAIPDTPQQYYCMADGDHTLYAVSGEVWEAYSQERLTLYAVPALDIQTALLSEILLTSPDGFSMKLEADGWYLTVPRRYPADLSGTSSLLTKLSGIRLASFVCHADGAALSEYGLAPAQNTLTLTFMPGVMTETGADGELLSREDIPARTFVLALGDDASDTMCYCLYEGAVYRGTLFSMNFLRTISSSALYARALINYPVNVMTAFTLETAGASARYELSLAERVLENNQLETDEYGNVLYDVIVQNNGTPVDTNTFLNWYALFASIAGAGDLPEGYTPRGEPVATVTLATEDATRTIAMYPYDALNLALVVDGVALYTTQIPAALTAALP